MPSYPTLTLTVPALPMYPTPRDWERMQDDIRAQARQVAEHFERIAAEVSQSARVNAGQVPARHVREYVFDALMGAVDDLTAAVEMSRQNAAEAA